MWNIDKKKTAKPNFLNKSGHSHKGRGATTVYERGIPNDIPYTSQSSRFITGILTFQTQV